MSTMPPPLCSYLEACESGSMFDGLLPDNITVYATTAANGQESSWGTYCPGMNPSPPPELLTCLGDLYRCGGRGLGAGPQRSPGGGNGWGRADSPRQWTPRGGAWGHWAGGDALGPWDAPCVRPSVSLRGRAYQQPPPPPPHLL